MNMALVNRGILHYMDMKKFLKNLVPGQNLFKIVPCVTFFKNCKRNFDSSKNMAAMGEAFFALCGLQRNASNFFSSETTGLILK